MKATTLRDVFRTADPTMPLESGDERYVDCTDVRGEDDVVDQLFDTIDWSESDRLTTQLFTGHRGCGKSTELLRLKERLEDSNYAVVYFQADDVLDLNDLVYSDILVAIVRQVYEYLEAQNIKLSSDLMDQVMEWFGEVVYEYKSVKEAEGKLAGEFKVGTPQILSPFGQMMLKLTGQLRTGMESRQNVRRSIEPQISQLIENINLMLMESEVRLKKNGLVVIIDNLDRITYRSLDEGQRNTHDALYIDHGEQLTSLHCHMLYTVPIAMFYSEKATILRSFFPDYLILPMIKVRTQDGQLWSDGVERLQEILGQRIDLDEIFEEAALDLICEISGGHPRDLMILVRNACRYAANPKPNITLEAAEKAVNRLVSEYSRMIPEEHLPLLAQVHRQKRIQIDEEHLSMLHNLSVLEYRNGGPPWQDVHPAVLRLPQFQSQEV